MPPTAPPSNKAVYGLAASLASSVLYDSIPNRWFEAEFEHLRVPTWFRPIFILAKGSGAVGLLAGLRWTPLGRLAARSLVVYFVLAVGAHVRVRDKPLRYLPAIGMLVSTLRVARSFAEVSPTSV